MPEATAVGPAGGEGSFNLASGFRKRSAHGTFAPVVPSVLRHHYTFSRHHAIQLHEMGAFQLPPAGCAATQLFLPELTITKTSAVTSPVAADRNASCSSAAEGLAEPGAHSASMPQACQEPARNSASADARSAALSISRTITQSGMRQNWDASNAAGKAGDASAAEFGGASAAAGAIAAA